MNTFYIVPASDPVECDETKVTYLYRSHGCNCQNLLPALEILRVQKLKDNYERLIAEGGSFVTYNGCHHRIYWHFSHVYPQWPSQPSFFVQGFQRVQELEGANHHFCWRGTQEIEPDEVIDTERFELEEVKRDIGSYEFWRSCDWHDPVTKSG